MMVWRPNIERDGAAPRQYPGYDEIVTALNERRIVMAYEKPWSQHRRAR